MIDEEKIKLNAKTKATIAFQGMLMAVPYIGSSIENFIFGPLAELRIQRIEKTLTEVADQLGEKNAKAAVNERFTTLLESVIPELSRAVNEDKRQRFRDLLTNVAGLPEDSNGWEEAQLASTLLKEIGTPGLIILAAIARAGDTEPVVLTSRPVSQVFQGKFDYDRPGETQQVLPYDWVVVEYWARWLREKRIISYSSHDARGGFGGVTIAELGKFLVKWTMRE